MPARHREETTERFSSVLEESKNRIWGAHIRVPVSITNRLSGRRVVCTLNGSATFQCAVLHRGKDLFLITINKALRTRLGLTFGMEVDVSLQPDRSVYGLPLPPEMKEVLRQDQSGNKLFHALTKGKQRTLLHIVGAVQSPEKRVFRALAIVNHLKTFNGSINYKELAKALRRRAGRP